MGKKIFHIIESTATGTLSAMRGLANSQCDEGNEVYVIYSIRPDTPKNLSNYFNSNIRLINIQMSSFLEVLISFIKIFKLIKQQKPQYIFLASSSAGFIGRIVGLFVSKKILFFYIPHCISYIRQDIGKIKKIIFIFLELVASLKKSLIIACSKSELEQIQNYIKTSGSILVENAVTPEYINLKLNKIRKRNVVTIGGIRPQKDPKNFAEIAKEIIKQDDTISFTWIGDGDHALKKHLINAGVEVIGWIDANNVKKKLLNSTLYLSTAKWEGMPISILEALACGLPTIAFNCPGNADIIKNREIGYVFDNNNEAIKILLSLINDKTKINNMSLNAHRIINEYFNLDRYNREINDIIKMIEN
jgi:glycosyltransferase involved in cell wall biosynthesis